MTALAGILNLTPDSFSGDGTLDVSAAVARADALAADGAMVIDIGAESTRPGATALSPEEEWQRLAPLVGALAGRKGKAVLSVDTRHAGTARACLARGFGWVNDVSGGADPRMLEAVAEAGATLVLMHSLSVPADSAKTLPAGADPVEVVRDWAKGALARCSDAGIPASKVIIDPGIGFGKTADQSLTLIGGIVRLKALPCPIMIGHSRKSFLSRFTDAAAEERDGVTLELSRFLVGYGVDYLRVHNVRDHAMLLTVRAAL